MAIIRGTSGDDKVRQAEAGGSGAKSGASGTVAAAGNGWPPPSSELRTKPLAPAWLYLGGNRLIWPTQDIAVDRPWHQPTRDTVRRVEADGDGHSNGLWMGPALLGGVLLWTAIGTLVALVV